MTTPTLDTTISFLAGFHVVAPFAKTGGGVADALEAAADSVMTSLLDFEGGNGSVGAEHGRHTDSASVSLDTERAVVEIEIVAHGASFEVAEHRAWQTITAAIAASGGHVVDRSPVPDSIPEELLFEPVHKNVESQAGA